jgi:uncharacterized membrane protein
VSRPASRDRRREHAGAAGRRRETTAPPPSRDWIVIALAAVGVAIAGYLTVTKLMGGSAAFCTAGGGCDAVQSSRYATMLGVPTALWGALAYAAIGGLALARLNPPRWQAAFALAAGAVGFSVYLTWISASVIHAFCPYCLASGAVAVVLLGVLVWRGRTLGGRRSPARPARMATVGVAAALAAIVLGAGIYAANPESAEPAYREGLARHLKDRGAVMYGAFT